MVARVENYSFEKICGKLYKKVTLIGFSHFLNRRFTKGGGISVGKMIV